jgi:hypothetical protein
MSAPDAELDGWMDRIDDQLGYVGRELIATLADFRRLSREHVAMESALRDLIHGAEMMSAPPFPRSGAFYRYCQEVKRVAQAGLPPEVHAVTDSIDVPQGNA